MHPLSVVQLQQLQPELSRYTAARSKQVQCLFPHWLMRVAKNRARIKLAFAAASVYIYLLAAAKVEYSNRCRRARHKANSVHS